jgi:predicted DNA-binding helix-hairpin-helix protein
VAEALYQKFDLKRVFYSAYISVNQDSSLPSIPGGPPLLREHRLYQADWLLRFYGFEASELLSEQKPNFNILLDPKCNWAIGHLEQFPIEINRADYYTLLRIPGIGVKSAQRIVKARKISNLNFDDLKKIGVVLKRALYFITCSGKMMYSTRIEEDYITNHLLDVKERLPLGISESNSFKQISLFDDVNFTNFNSMKRSFL